jgi:hypothetical protein
VDLAAGIAAAGIRAGILKCFGTADHSTSDYREVLQEALELLACLI